jgi:hypothetical protein
MTRIAFAGCGFVADLYAGTLEAHPELELAGVVDRDANRARAFAARYGAKAYEKVRAAFKAKDWPAVAATAKDVLAKDPGHLDAHRMLGSALAAAIAGRRHMAVIESLVRWAGFTLEANEGLVRELIHRRAAFGFNRLPPSLFSHRSPRFSRASP